MVFMKGEQQASVSSVVRHMNPETKATLDALIEESRPVLEVCGVFYFVRKWKGQYECIFKRMKAKAKRKLLKDQKKRYCFDKRLLSELAFLFQLQAHYSTGKVSTGFTSTVIVPHTTNEAGGCNDIVKLLHTNFFVISSND
jgi:hypothetical protein